MAAVIVNAKRDLVGFVVENVVLGQGSLRVQ
jgi:hypothetical protein